MDLRSQVSELKAQHPTWSFSQIGKALSISKDRARGLYVRAPGFTPPRIQNSQEIKITGDVIVVGDVHVPYTNKKLVELVREAAQKFGIKQIAIVGDLFSFSSLSKWPTIVREPTVSEELRGARELLSYWMQHFDQAFMCMGNHDLRLLGAVKGELGPDNLADMFRPPAVAPARLRMTMRDRMWLSTKPKWLLAHQVMYGRAKLSIAQQLSATYECNVLTHHQHHQAVGQSANGKYIIADNGCLCDANSTPYKALVTNSFPEWCVGFSIFTGGTYLPYWHGKPFGYKF